MCVCVCVCVVEARRDPFFKRRDNRLLSQWHSLHPLCNTTHTPSHTTLSLSRTHTSQLSFPPCVFSLLVVALPTAVVVVAMWWWRSSANLVTHREPLFPPPLSSSFHSSLHPSLSLFPSLSLTLSVFLSYSLSFPSSIFSPPSLLFPFTLGPDTPSSSSSSFTSSHLTVHSAQRTQGS